MVHHVAAKLVRVVAEAVREAVALRVEHDPGGRERRCVEEDHLGEVFRHLAGVAVLHAHARGLVGLGVENHFGDDRVRRQRHVAGMVGGDQGCSVRREVGAERAAAHAKVARLAGAAADLDLLVGRLGQVGGAAHRDASLGEFALDLPLERLLDDVEFHRRLEHAIRQLRQTLIRTADTHPAFDMVVPGGEVGIADRPVDADPFLGVGLEVEIAPAIALPAPGDRPAADMIPADPVEAVHLGVGMLVILHEPVVPLIVDGVACAGLLLVMLLDLVLRGAAARIAEIPRVLVEGRIVLAMLHLPAAFEHQRLQALFAELLGRPPAGDAAADDDRIECAFFPRTLFKRRHGRPPDFPRSHL